MGEEFLILDSVQIVDKLEAPHEREIAVRMILFIGKNRVDIPHPIVFIKMVVRVDSDGEIFCELNFAPVC